MTTITVIWEVIRYPKHLMQAGKNGTPSMDFLTNREQQLKARCKNGTPQIVLDFCMLATKSKTYKPLYTVVLICKVNSTLTYSKAASKHDFRGHLLK